MLDHLSKFCRLARFAKALAGVSIAADADLPDTVSDWTSKPTCLGTSDTPQDPLMENLCPTQEEM